MPTTYNEGPIWTTRSKAAIPIRELTTDHLNNIHSMMVRHPSWRNEFRGAILEELKRREKPKPKKPTAKEMRSKHMAIAANRTKKIIEKSKDNSALLESTIKEQQELIAQCDAALEIVFDLIVDAEGVIEDETMDDIFGLDTMKQEIGKQMKQVTAWKEKQNDELLSTSKQTD